MGTNKQKESVIHATEMRVLRHIAEKSMVDRVRNVEVRDKRKQEVVLEKVKESRDMDKIFGRDGSREISKEV